MDEKAFAIIFVIILVIGVVGVGFSKMSASFNATSASPTPAASQVQAQQQQQQQMTQPGQKQIKQYSKFPGVLKPEDLKGRRVMIQTAKGNIGIEIFDDTPITSSNFLILAKDGFYDGLTFHRVEPGFVIQGGDPLGNGTGGPGYKFQDEKVTRKYDKGIVAMANSGPNTNGSQFFIMLDDNLSLPPNYTIFGKVIQGQDVVDSIQVGDVMQKVSVE